MTPTQEQAIRDRLAAVLASPQAPAAIYPIAHAPQDIADLLAEVERLRAALKETLAALETTEWEGCDASAMPLCSWCKRDPPDYDRRELIPLDERHDSDCGFVAVVTVARGALGDTP